MSTLFSLTVALAVSLPSAVFARQVGDESPRQEAAQDAARTAPGGASKGAKACHEDIERYCRSVEPGGGRLGRCLKANAEKLSEPCRRWLAHGGLAHVDRAFQEIDASTGPARAPAPSRTAE